MSGNNVIADGLGEEEIDQFKSAVKSGDAAKVKSLIASIPALASKLNEPWFDFDSPAIHAAHHNRETLDALLDAGADINARSQWWAGSFGILDTVDPETAAYLISRGATLDAHSAAHLGMLDELKTIIRDNPELVNAPGGDGKTPLHFAATPEIAEYLLDQGADIHKRDVDHCSTAAQHTVRKPEVCRALIKRGAEVDIFMACAIGDIDRARDALKANPELLHKRIGDKDYPPVPAAPGEPIYFYLLGAQFTPLHVAAVCEQKEIVKLLLDLGADPNVGGAYDDSTPLHACAWQNKPGAVSLLIERGADVNRKSGELHKNTPLGWAIVAGSVEMAKLLLENGAQILDYFLRDAQKGERGAFRQYAHADLANYAKIVELLRQRGAQ